MNKRHVAAIALLGLGMLICIGTIGDADFNGMWATEYYIRACIGIALLFAAVPVSGDIPRKGGDENERN